MIVTGIRLDNANTRFKSEDGIKIPFFRAIEAGVSASQTPAPNAAGFHVCVAQFPGFTAKPALPGFNASAI
jgi:hypothetical protein